MVARIVMGFLECSGREGAFEEAVNHILRASWTRWDADDDRSPFEWEITLSDFTGYEYLCIWVSAETAEIEVDDPTRRVFRRVDEWSWLDDCDRAPNSGEFEWDSNSTIVCRVDRGLPYTEYLESICDLFRESAVMDPDCLMPGTPRRPLMSTPERTVVGLILRLAVDAAGR